MLNEKTDSHTANDGVNMFPLELCPPKTLNCVYQELAIIPGNVALCEPVDLTQNIHASMNGATFMNIQYMLILDCKLKPNVSGAIQLHHHKTKSFINKEICIMSPRSHTELFSYVYFQVLVRISQPCF